MVKIDTISSSQKASLRRLTKTSKSGSSSFASSISQASDTEESAMVSAPNHAQFLFSLQEVNEKEVAKSHGDKILNFLDNLRLNMLTGNMQNNQLIALKQYLNSSTSNFSDAKLKGIMEEIEQRANIEMAKRGLI